MTEKIKYAQVDNDPSDDGEEYQKPVQQRSGWISTLSSFLLGLVTMGVAMGLYSAFMMPHPLHARNLPQARNGTDPDTGLPLSFSHGDCGNSPEDAKARGCQYNIVLHSWLPKSCLTEADAEDAKDMYKDHKWPYETTSGQNLTMEELGAGDYEYFMTTFDFHVTHCMYVWKRLHRIMLDPALELDTYTADYGHTSHCVEMITGYPDGIKGSSTKIFVKYPKCAK
ncbi:hypothetical protein GQ53DRAFT_884348 [Thozetella sp. PMI_491]|nr:hypothetical protein GQ53DRAFT_884348 [Thozetella sp. PMI_491]